MLNIHKICFYLAIQVLFIKAPITNKISVGKEIPNYVSSKTCVLNIKDLFQLRLLESTSVSFYQIHPGQTNKSSATGDQSSLVSPYYPIYFVVKPQCKKFSDSTVLGCTFLQPCNFLLQSENMLIPPSVDWVRKDQPNPGEFLIEFHVNQDLFLNVQNAKYSTRPVTINMFIVGKWNYYQWTTDISIVGKLTSASTFFCRRASTSVYRDKVILKPGDDFACFVEAKGFAAGSQNKKITNINASLYDFEKPYIVPFDTSNYNGQNRIADGELARFGEFLYHTQESGIETDKSVKNPGSKTDIALIILNMTIEHYGVSGRYCVAIEIRPNPGDKNGNRMRLRGSKNSCFTYEAPPTYEWVIYLVVVVVLLSACGLIFFLKMNK
eukprot:GAHX01000145.1.p1 GENE.GAHX01000145.1~~GAHX01000145.1.p1  ORF type:complete len:381 (-),score=59.92 GAHX01000145.1:25-1167(-)